MRRWRIYCSTESSNVFVYASSPPTVCANNIAHTVVAESSSVVNWGVPGSMYWGSGNDGDVVISSNTSLVRDMYYLNLTITAGHLNTAGFRVFVRGMLTISSGATIGRKGNDGVGTAAGAALAAAFLGGGTSGGAGGANSAGGSGGTPVANSSLGSRGGDAGGGGVNPGGTSPNISILSAVNGSTGVIANPSMMVRGRGAAGVVFSGGTGGGGGGADVAGLGGGGGSGGGVVVICAQYINAPVAIAFVATGGNGGTSSGAASPGAGGGGGSLFILTRSDPDNISVDVTGGSGGTVSSTNGTAIIYQI